MVNWQVTATTIYCDAVDDDVTLMVYKDGTVKCVGYQRYHQPNRDTSKLMERKSKKLDRKLECEGPECRWIVQYRDKLFAEEAKKDSAKSSGGEMVGRQEGEGD